MMGASVVTICQGEVGFLPLTETITSLPLLDEEGAPRPTQEERLESAYQEMRARGETPA